MLRLGRCIPILTVLVIVGGLNTGCKAPTAPSPMATPPQTVLQPIAQPAIATGAAGPTRTPTQDVPSSHTPTPGLTQTATSTPIPPTATPTCTATPWPRPPSSTDTLTSTTAPLPSTTPVPATATPAPTATRTRLPPTSTPSPYRFLPAGPAQPDPSHPCPGCPLAPAYIVGCVLDAAGNPLAGVRLVCYNEWHRYPVVASKAGGDYDFAITQAETTWYVVVLDQADQPLSPEVAVRFDPHETCRYILNWRRAN
jgi:hypothetical protein